VKILFDNVNISSSSGPNSFGRQLLSEFKNLGHDADVNVSEPNVQLSFIQTNKKLAKLAKLALRLDGIYFNTRQDWEMLNRPIKESFDLADLVVYQSNFNKRLTEKYFSSSKRSFVINNGTQQQKIKNIKPLQHQVLNNFSEIWSCASSWRPHKRLKDNIDYFLEVAPATAGLVVAGENPDYRIDHPRVMYAGQLSWESCISLYKRSKVFIHLAFLDHCPNVVVDARSSGCQIIVSSSGGTKEIAGLGATIVRDIEWDLRPLDLYSPPKLDIKQVYSNDIDSCLDINYVAKKYLEAFETLENNQ